MFIEYQEGRETMLILYKFSLFNINRSYRLSLKTWGIALKFLFLHHEHILFPND